MSGERVRNFISLHRSGVLSTLASDGSPFGSVVVYDLTPSGEIVIAISSLAEHTRNLLTDPRSSLCVVDHGIADPGVAEPGVADPGVAESFGLEDPLRRARATVVGKFVKVSDSELEEIRSSYLRRFPASFLASDFSFFRMAPDRVRWIGGFGEIGWVSGDDFRSAST